MAAVLLFWNINMAAVTSSENALSEEKTRSDHVTRNALATWNNEAYGQANADSRSVQSFAIIKNTGQGNFFIGRFQTRARNGLSV